MTFEEFRKAWLGRKIVPTPTATGDRVIPLVFGVMELYDFVEAACAVRFGRHWRVFPSYYDEDTLCVWFRLGLLGDIVVKAKCNCRGNRDAVMEELVGIAPGRLKGSMRRRPAASPVRAVPDAAVSSDAIVSVDHSDEPDALPF